MSSTPEWERSSDQEVIELLRQGEGALWGVAQGQLLAWNLTSERLHRASTPTPSGVKVHDLWVEPLDVRRLNQARARYYKSYVTKMSEAKPQENSAQLPAQESVIDLDGIEIEGEGSEGSSTQATEEVVELDLSDMVIDTTTSPAPKVQPKRALPPAPLEVVSRFQVYLATSKGIYKREVWLDAQWRDLLGDQDWRRIYQGEVTQLSPRSSGGAWWAGERGFGWLQKGKIAGKLERMRASQVSMKRGGGAWVLLHDPSFQSPQLISVAERIWQDGGEPLGIDERSAPELLNQLDPERLKRGVVCPGSPLQLVSAQVVTSKEKGGDKAMVRSFALCKSTKQGDALMLSVEDEGRWRWMTIEGLKGEGRLQIAPWAGTVLLKAERAWWVMREGLRTGSMSPVAPADEQLSLHMTAQEQTQAPLQVHLARLNFEELLPYAGGAWTTGVDQDGSPWLSWARDHQGVVSRVGAQGGLRKRFETESFAAYNETRPYSLDHQGTLWIPQLQGASTFGLGEEAWRYVKAPEGRTLGVAHCATQALFVIAKRTLKPKPKLTLELWTPGAQAPLAQIDWSDALFRLGEPKLGDVACDQEGAIYGALFWGQGWSGSGVGVLHIPAERTKVEVWGARQGFDGEEELTETPLLPDFTVNAVAIAPDRRVFLATNSGLAVVSAPTQPATKRSLTLLSESSGWVTDFINDVSVGVDGRAWVATDKGLFVLNQQLQARLTTLKLRMSAVAVEPNTGLIWVALHDRLYRGDGQIETWERVSVEGSFPLGTIKRVLPFDEARVRGAQGRAQVWLATTRGLLRTRVAQR